MTWVNRPVASIFQGGVHISCKVIYIYICIYVRLLRTYVCTYVCTYVRTYLNKDKLTVGFKIALCHLALNGFVNGVVVRWEIREGAT